MDPTGGARGLLRIGRAAMITIWKYPLQLVDHQELTMPRRYKLLTVQMQGLTPCLWALVDTDQPGAFDIPIDIRGTGHNAHDVLGMDYIGTIQLPDKHPAAGLVFHFFGPRP